MNNYFVLYDFVSGKELSRASVNLKNAFFSKDGTKFVALDYSGVVKSYSVPDSKLLTSTIADTSGDWLTYTPEGYFTGSPGGINKFVHLVDGMQVFELGQMYDTLYRPDLVQAKLEGKDIGKPVLKELVATGDAPTVQFVGSPMATARTVTLEFSVQDTGGGVGYVYLSQNGKAMQVSAGEESKVGRQFVYSCNVTLAKGENVFEAYAANSANKIESRHVSASLNWQGNVENSSLYVLAMGVDKYERMPQNNLSYSVADATAIINSFMAAPGGLYDTVNVMSLLDGEVNKANIQKAFDTFASKVKPDDMFVLHVAGHGLNYDGEYYFMPADSYVKSEADYAKYGVSKHFLTENLSKIPALNTLVLLDTCYSGAFIDAQATGNALAQKTALEHLAHTSGQVILTASANSQTAGEGYKGHGVFTYAILEALSGKANYNADSSVSIKEVTQYIGYEIPNIYEEMGAARQSPWNSPLRGDFSVVAFGKRTPSRSVTLSLSSDVQQTQWVAKRIVDDYSSEKTKVARKTVSDTKMPIIQKKESPRKSEKEAYGRAKGMNLFAGYAKGAVFDGFDIGTQIYFLGGKYFFAGAEADFIFNNVNDKSADIDKFTLMNIDAVLGLSANLLCFRPYVQGGLGVYTSFVPDSKTDTSYAGLSLHGAFGSDVVFGKFYVGGAYRLMYLNGSGYVDNYIVNIGWNW